MCELMAMCFARPLYADISIRAFAVRDKENADGWGLAWYPDQSLAIAKEPITWRESQYAEFLQTYAHLQSNLYIAHVRKRTFGGEPTWADTHPFARELRGREYCFAHNGTIRSAHRDLRSDRFQPIGDTDSEQVFCHVLEEIAQRSKGPPQADGTSRRSATGRSARRGHEGAHWKSAAASDTDFRLRGFAPRGARTSAAAAAPLKFAAAHRWLHRKFAAINELGKFNVLLSDGERLFCYHDINGFKGLWLCLLTANHHREEHHLDDPTLHVDFETEPANSGVIIATVPLNDEPGWRRLEPGVMIAVEAGQIVYEASTVAREADRSRQPQR